MVRVVSAERKRKSRAERREDRRDALKSAAADVFAEHGYHAAKVSQIVERVGVAQGTFYLYYESKQQIFGELLQDFLTLVVSTVAAWEPADLDSREVFHRELTRVGLMLTEVTLDNQALAAIFFREALAVAPEFDAMIHEFYDTLAAMLTDFNRILCERGLIEPANFRVLAYMTIGMVERIIQEYVVAGTLTDVEPAEIVDHLITHFLFGTTRPMPQPRTEGGE
jgi:AcrR family transcriptional regulator